MAIYSKAKNWYDYEMRITNFNLDSTTPLKDQWNSFTKNEQWDEIEINLDAICDAKFIMDKLRNEVENLERLINIAVEQGYKIPELKPREESEEPEGQSEEKRELNDRIAQFHARLGDSDFGNN